MKRKIYSPAILATYKANFTNNHSKFIHAHPTKLEDLGKDFTFEGKTLTLVGMNDDGLAVLHEASTNYFYICSLKMVKGLPETSVTADETADSIIENIEEVEEVITLTVSETLA